MKYSEKNKAENTFVLDRRVLNRFLKFAGDLNMDGLSGFILEKFKHERLKNKKRSTVNFEISKVKAFTSWCEKIGYVAADPLKHVSRVKEEPRDVRVLSADEEEALLTCSPPRTRFFIEIALNTGMRHREILNLKWSDIDFKNRILSVKKSKTGDNRDIPINSRLYAVLSETQERRVGDWVISRDGKKMVTAEVGFNSAVRRAGIPHIRIHDLRHTFITNLLHAKVDARTIMEFSGHKTYSMFTKYSHPQSDHKKQAIERLADTTDCKNFGRILETLPDKKNSDSDK